MQQYLITFRSMTAAQQASFALSRAGLPGQLLRAPKQISSMGCAYALRVGPESVRSAVSVLRMAGIFYDHVFVTGPGGLYREAAL